MLKGKGSLEQNPFTKHVFIDVIANKGARARRNFNSISTASFISDAILSITIIVEKREKKKVVGIQRNSTEGKEVELKVRLVLGSKLNNFIYKKTHNCKDPKNSPKEVILHMRSSVRKNEIK